MHPLKEAIFSKGLSVYEFSQKTGLTASCLYKIFKGGSTHLQASTYWCISQVLEIPIRDICKMVKDDNV